MTSAVGVPGFEMTFLVTGIPREEQVQESDELSSAGKVKPS